MQGNWDDIAQDACGGFVTAFEYFEQDLSDDIEAFTITNVQPHVLNAHAASNNSDAPTWTQALQGPFQDKWWEAMEAELNTLENDLHAWELVTKVDWINILQSTWAFRFKQFHNGLVKKLKLSLVYTVISKKKAPTFSRYGLLWFNELWCGR